MTDSPGIWDLARQYMLAECALSFIAIAWNQLDAIKDSPLNLDPTASKHLNDAIDSIRQIARDMNDMRDQRKSKLYDATHEKGDNASD